MLFAVMPSLLPSRLQRGRRRLNVRCVPLEGAAVVALRHRVDAVVIVMLVRLVQHSVRQLHRHRHRGQLGQSTRALWHGRDRLKGGLLAERFEDQRTAAGAILTTIERMVSGRGLLLLLMQCGRRRLCLLLGGCGMPTRRGAAGYRLGGLKVKCVMLAQRQTDGTAGELIGGGRCR